MNILKFLALINNFSKQKKLIFSVPLKHEYLKYLQFFKKLNIIIGFYFKFNRIYIYLTYFNSLPVLSNIIFISKPSNKVILSFRSLQRICFLYSSSVFLLSTPNGIITHIEALRLKSSGILLAQIV